MFAQLPDVTFRLSAADRVPSLVTRIDEQVALLPLRKIQREFGIEEGSPDAEMLGFVIRALDFVHELRPGDPLPGEALGCGQASWEPGPQRVRAAAARMRLQLAALFVDAGAADSEAEVIRAAGRRAEDLAKADPELMIAMLDDPRGGARSAPRSPAPPRISASPGGWPGSPR